MRFFVLMAAVGATGLALLVITAAFGADPGAAAVIGPGSPHLNPIESFALSTYLLVRMDGLQTRPESDETPVAFAVVAGESAGDVAVRLQQLGLVADDRLLRTYMRYNGIDRQIEAGNFELLANMTIPEVASALTHALPTEITFRVWEGWRSEQVADALLALGRFDLTREAWDRLVRREAPLPGSYSFTREIAAEASSLEGFLFPDTYRFLPEASTEEIVDRMLRTFDERVAPDIAAQAAGVGLSPYEVVVLASIVEREAVQDDERPLIAGVFLNRIVLGMRLDADPTTQYALAAPGHWWPELDLDPRLVDSPYNTYVMNGLPPGPISNPGLASIRAVLNPADTAYLYFRATCEKDGRHNFSRTYEEHLAYACSTSASR